LYLELLKKQKKSESFVHFFTKTQKYAKQKQNKEFKEKKRIDR